MKFPSGFYGQRLSLVADAARVLRDEINRAPTCQAGRLVPATVEGEYANLRNEDDAFDYLDDLEARCGVNVTDARALLAVAYGATAEEFPNHYWQVARG